MHPATLAGWEDCPLVVTEIAMVGMVGTSASREQTESEVLPAAQARSQRQEAAARQASATLRTRRPEVRAVRAAEAEIR